MNERNQPQNPYTNLAIEAMRSIGVDPGNELIYTQRAMAYAAIAQAIELEELGTALRSIGVPIAQTPDVLESISNSIDRLPRLQR